MTRRFFTLIEVVIATAILAIALGAIMSMAGQAKADMARVMEVRARAHSMQLATEWFLLADPADLVLPGGLLPDGYVAICDVEEVTDELPDHAQEPRDGWVLVRYVVRVIDNEGDELGEQRIYRLIREDAL